MASKQVTVGNKTYNVPEGFDETAAIQQLEIEKGIGEGITAGITAAERAPIELEQAQGASLLDMRRDAARTLQSARGLTRSGRGLGVARDVGLATDVKAGALRGQYAEAINTSRQEAAAAKVEGLVEQGKLLEAQASRAAAGAEAGSTVQAIQKKYSGDIYTTKGDRARMITDIKVELAKTTSPHAAMVFQNAITNLQAGKTVNSGTLDISI
jgi:hypothetical protein